MDTVQMNGTELVVKQETSPEKMAAMMQETGVTARDIQIPRLLLMQNTSEIVGNDKAKLGDLVHSQNLDVLGGATSPVEIVPLKLYKTIRIMDMSGGTPKFKRLEPWTAKLEAMPWEDSEDGVKIRRYTCFNFMVLLKSELESGTAFPMTVTFKSSSLNAGKQLATHIFKQGVFRQAAWAQSVPIIITKQKMETNSYAVMNIGKGTTLPLALQSECKQWADMLGQMTYNVDEDKDEAPAAGVVVPPTAGAGNGIVSF